MLKVTQQINASVGRELRLLDPFAGVFAIFSVTWEFRTFHFFGIGLQKGAGGTHVGTETICVVQSPSVGLVDSA